jgi:hypothetical protein
VKSNCTVPVVVEGGGTGAVAHVGLHALGSFADRLEFGHSLSSVIPWTGERAPVHDRGKVVVQAMLMLAGGGEACTDIEHLRPQGVLFGQVCSDSTLHRVFHQLDATTRSALWGAVAGVRAEVWSRTAATVTGEVVLDIDASLHEIHSENKAGTAAHYKGGFGFHPLYCFADATGECLGVKLRPGNAGANSIADHVEVLDQAIAGLPEQAAVGHRPGDDEGQVRRRLRVRTDSAGCTRFVHRCRERNVGFSVVARRNHDVHAAISRIRFDAWCPAVTQDGEECEGAAVAELTRFVDLSDWPDGTRLIVRREPLHQGAQGSLFPSETFRYWGHYTDSELDPVAADVDMRGHARVEDNIRRVKDTGANRFPFSDLDANTAWLDVVCFADALVRWFQLLCMPEGRFAAAEPKTMRWGIWHTPARLVRHARRHVVRIIDGWPTTGEILTAYRRIELLI